MEPSKEIEEVIDEEDIKELLEMTRENNEILHGMRRRERIGNILKIFYIGFIILSVYGAYVFVEPYIKEVKDIVTKAQTTQSNIQSTATEIGTALGVSPLVSKMLLEATKGIATTTQR